ncbi:MAG: NAD(P)H-hydrate dehydratase [Oscillatoriophycideae cyanobacterium NC_groundwater_1537_Pr4_S-0.65um_50_18]|nr:NAD(P)H-hydrate dehydratase [Oscillatoriophycideae cyanobacterium NC_groundwater_1537_Pr4_S-0.65um_50_18]
MAAQNLNDKNLEGKALDASRRTLARVDQIQSFAVTAEQMRQIEGRVFAAGMPVAALMEKVGGLLVQRLLELDLLQVGDRIGVLVGPGHNGGDALVMARELHLRGYEVCRYQPFTHLKDLTAEHSRYADSLGIAKCDPIESLQTCDLVIDGLFGFGLTRSLEEEIALAVQQVNQWQQPILSIDLPSGLQTDTGAALGVAIRATHTFCLGLWKLAFLQDQALEYLGKAELIDFGLPFADIESVLGAEPQVQRLTSAAAIAALPLPRPASTHKYQQGHLLLVCGSRRYMGAALLAGSAARSSGVGMLSIAVPQSFQSLLVSHLPDALVLGCPETESGAIAHLPDEVDLAKYNAIACGSGLTTAAKAVVQQVLESPCPLILDADGLNILASQAVMPLQQRQAATVLTPHTGEFKRLFPALSAPSSALSDDRLQTVQKAAEQSGAIVLLKGARTAIAHPQGRLWLNPDSTPALARGGSGDVLTGLMGGLLAQEAAKSNGLKKGAIASVQSAAWWHAQAALLAAQTRTELGVDATTLSQFLIPALQKITEI